MPPSCSPVDDLATTVAAITADQRAKPDFRASRHGMTPRGLAGLYPTARCPWQASPRQGNSGSSKPQIGDCCNALIIAAAAVRIHPNLGR